MDSIDQVSKKSGKTKWVIWSVVATVLALALLVAVVTPNLLRSRSAARMSAFLGQERSFSDENVVEADGSKIIRAARLDLRVSDCVDTQKKIEGIAAAESGFIESSEVQPDSAIFKLRVPGSQFESARARLKALAIQVTQDTINAADVSKQYVDKEARLRNLRSAEQQYLEIMKRSHTVADVLAVTKELSEVRGEIEKADAEMRVLKDQVDMASIEVHVSADRQTPTGVNWAPGSSAKQAWHDLVQSLANLVDFLIWLVINIPILLLWGITIYLLALVCWFLLKKAWRGMKRISPTGAVRKETRNP
jgi:hypothetical protein